MSNEEGQPAGLAGAKIAPESPVKNAGAGSNPGTGQPQATPSSQAERADRRPARGKRRWLLGAVALAVLIAVLFWGIPAVVRSLNAVSTNDAYVNGHVTFVAPRVAGQVTRVLVDDNNYVHKGDLLVELDPEPFQVQLEIAKAALVAAEADFVAAQATKIGRAHV